MNPDTQRKIDEIYAYVVGAQKVKSAELLRTARAVVAARKYHGDDGWDRLKNAIADLEGEVEKITAPR